MTIFNKPTDSNVRTCKVCGQSSLISIMFDYLALNPDPIINFYYNDKPFPAHLTCWDAHMVAQKLLK